MKLIIENGNDLLNFYATGNLDETDVIVKYGELKALIELFKTTSDKHELHIEMLTENLVVKWLKTYGKNNPEIQLYKIKLSLNELKAGVDDYYSNHNFVTWISGTYDLYNEVLIEKIEKDLKELETVTVNTVKENE